MIPENVHLNIGSLLFEDLDQIDLTGAFEVLSRLPNATHRIYAKSIEPVPLSLRMTEVTRRMASHASASLAKTASK